MLDVATEIVIGVVLASVVLLVFVYLLHQLRNRKRDARLQMQTTMPVADQAFNQIRIARAGADHLARDGYEVAGVRSVLDRAETLAQQGSSGEALRLADSAKERMVEIRRDPRGRTGLVGAVPPSPGLGLGAPVAPAGPAPTLGLGGTGGAEAVPAEPDRPKLPTHQVEARFALQLLRKDLEHASPRNGKAAVRREASSLADEAEAAYGRKEYTEAWKLALRGRRRLGGDVESVGVRPGAGLVPPSEPAGGGVPCPKCQHANAPNDRFCRGCGAAIAVGKCDRCGRVNEPTDQFCGTCGSPLAQ
jgi:hypothetical protein